MLSSSWSPPESLRRAFNHIGKILNLLCIVHVSHSFPDNVGPLLGVLPRWRKARIHRVPALDPRHTLNLLNLLDPALDATLH